MKNINITVIAVAIIGLAVGFFGGMKYQQIKVSQVTAQNRTEGFNGQRGNRMGQGIRPVNGEIISQDDKSITVKLPDGSSRIVLLSGSTQINKAEKTTKDDLKIGERVAAFGSENPDGSITAQSIQLNPQLRGGTGSPSALLK